MKTIYLKNVYCLWGQAKSCSVNHALILLQKAKTLGAKRSCSFTFLLRCLSFAFVKESLNKSCNRFMLHNDLAIIAIFIAVSLCILHCICDRICPMKILPEFQWKTSSCSNIMKHHDTVQITQLYSAILSAVHSREQNCCSSRAYAARPPIKWTCCIKALIHFRARSYDCNMWDKMLSK